MADLEVVQQKFDGHSIDLYAGRFQGTFDIDLADAEGQKIDSEIFYMVRVKVRGAAFNETKNGDLQRTNLYAVAEATKVPNAIGFKLQTAISAQMAINFDSDLFDDDDADE